jgi:hypothetical protein
MITHTTLNLVSLVLLAFVGIAGLITGLVARARRIRKRIAANEAAQNCPHGIRRWKKCRPCAEDFVREVEAEREGKVWEMGVDPARPGADQTAISGGPCPKLRLTLTDSTPPVEQFRLLVEWWRKTGQISQESGEEINEWKALNQARLTITLKIDPTKKEGYRS